MRIGINVDGVLTDIERWQLDYGSKYFLSNHDRTIANHKGYEAMDVFNVEEANEADFWNKYLKLYVTKEPARPFAAEIIRKLKKENNDIFIITARKYTTEDSSDGKKMRKILLRWLKRNGIIYDKIIFTNEDKLDACIANDIDVMIEDKTDNIYNISKKLPVLCFHANYNEGCTGPNITRCYSWYDAYVKLKKMASKKK